MWEEERPRVGAVASSPSFFLRRLRDRRRQKNDDNDEGGPTTATTAATEAGDEGRRLHFCSSNFDPGCRLPRDYSSSTVNSATSRSAEISIAAREVARRSDKSDKSAVSRKPSRVGVGDKHTAEWKRRFGIIGPPVFPERSAKGGWSYNTRTPLGSRDNFSADSETRVEYEVG